MKLSKSDKKQIAELSKMLPEIPVATTKIVTGAEILVNDKLKKYRTPDIKPDAKYKLRENGSPVAVNHRRRIEKLFIQGGIYAVKQYVDYFKPKDATPSIEA